MKHRVKNWVRDHAPDEKEGVVAPMMSIGRAAELTGLSVSALRKYEAAGLIMYHRTESGYRVLSEEDLIRIRLIQHLIKVKGLNLEGIRRLWALLPCWELKSCSAEARTGCPVLEGTNDPCWVVYEDEGGCDGGECRTCEVYRMAATCTEDLKKLVLDLLVNQKKR